MKDKKEKGMFGKLKDLMSGGSLGKKISKDASRIKKEDSLFGKKKKKKKDEYEY